MRRASATGAELSSHAMVAVGRLKPRNASRVPVEDHRESESGVLRVRKAALPLPSCVRALGTPIRGRAAVFDRFHSPSIMLLTHSTSTSDKIADRITIDNDNSDSNSNSNSNSVVCASSVILTLSSCISNRASRLNAERDQERP